MYGGRGEYTLIAVADLRLAHDCSAQTVSTTSFTEDWAMSDSNYFRWDQIADKEFRQIQVRRVKALAQKEVDPASQEIEDLLKESAEAVPLQEERRLIGLAFSGGGIRSATFGLGVLQGLADLGLLRFCDYLSTVSGGGYIGSWLAAWIKREGSLDNVEKQLRPCRRDEADAERGFENTRLAVGDIRSEEPEPISHLREFSNYLAPRLNLLSSDAWSLVAIYVRNLVANQMVLLPALLAIMLVAQLVGAYFAQNVSPSVGNPTGIIAIAMLVTGFSFLARGLSLIRDPLAASSAHPAVGVKCLAATLALVGTACVLLSWALLPNPSPPDAKDPPNGRTSGWDQISGDETSGGNSSATAEDARQQQPPSKDSHEPQIKLKVLLAFAAILGLFHALFSYFVENAWWRTAIGLLSGAVAGMLLYLSLVGLLWRHASDYACMATFGPPLFFLIFSFANIVEVSLLGRIAAEQEREWRSRFNAWTMILATLWIVVIGIALYGGGWCRAILGEARWPGLASVGAWLMTVVSGLLAANSSKTKGDDNRGWMEILVRVTPFVFLIGMSLLLAWAAQWLAHFEQYGKVAQNPDWHWLLGSLAICLAVAVLASWRVDVNEFSLSAMYGSRLVRCYLGACRRKQDGDYHGTPAHCHGPDWDPNRVTGFDSQDDLPLTKLRIGGPSRGLDEQRDPQKEQNYWGPFPLINTALNLVAGERLAWQERRAESFLLSPLFCGCKTLGYRKADHYAAGYAAESPLTLGRCMAISGAAACPNMGYHTSPAVAALLTVCNVRLGWWLPNPGESNDPRDPTWRSRGPAFLVKWLAIELASATNSKRRYLNVSDGGHFENLGVYELVRRRCRLIIVSDAGADPAYECADLGMLIRKCRTDFGIDIEIDTSQLKPVSDEQTSKWHCAVGTIRYDYVNPKAPVGTLVYIKPSLTGDESADVQHYARTHPDFPQQSTLNQFYGESQFESYRQLGYHCVTEVLGDIAKRLKAGNKTDPHIDPAIEEFSDILDWVRDCHSDLAENFVYHLRTQWLAPAVESYDDSLESVENLKKFQCDLRDKAELSPISRGLYPDLPWDAQWNGGPAVRQADVHAASLMLQIMENAYWASDLENQSGHPLNAGRMNLFHRWAQSGTLRRYWPLLRNEYGRDFVFFCERELALKSELEKLQPMQQIDAGIWKRMIDEFNREWPKEKGRRRGLEDLHDAAVLKGTNGGGGPVNVPAAWYIRVRAPRGTLEQGDPLSDGFVAGVVAVRPLADKLKLEEAELDRLKTKLKVDDNGSFEQDFWELTSAGLREKLAEHDEMQFMGKLEGRAGYELVVWVRPGFRHLKVGQHLLEEFMDMISYETEEGQRWRWLLGRGRPIKLAVFFPRSGWRTADDKFAGVARMWLTFFSFYGFRRPGDDWPSTLYDEVLAWDSSQC